MAARLQGFRITRIDLHRAWEEERQDYKQKTGIHRTLTTKRFKGRN